MTKVLSIIWMKDNSGSFYKYEKVTITKEFIWVTFKGNVTGIPVQQVKEITFIKDEV